MQKKTAAASSFIASSHREIPVLGLVQKVHDSFCCRALRWNVLWAANCSRGEPLSGACSCLGGLFCTVPRWCFRLERAQEVPGNCGYLVGSRKKCGFVGFRWLVEAAHLSHE